MNLIYFAARRLNTNEDSEGMLGYELYSSALADVLSEPTLTTPITVGLYAKWGSGKSFFLGKLREEMHSFARQWADVPIKSPLLLFVIYLHIATLIGILVGFSSWSYVWSLTAAFTFLVTVYGLQQLLRFANRRYDMDWTYDLDRILMKRIGRLRLVLQVAFCHPPGQSTGDKTGVPVRFHFSEASSAAASGESAIGLMLGSLYDAIEAHYGALPTRLFRALRPRPVKSSSLANWRFRRMCCMPLILLFEMAVFVLLAGLGLLLVLNHETDFDKEAVKITLYFLGSVLLVALIGNLRTVVKVAQSLCFSQGRQLRRVMQRSTDNSLTALGLEVSLMTDMVQCLDGFTGQQSRLVGVVDALDQCDTERTLTMLNAIQTLLQSQNRPFVMLLAVDPHVIAKAAEANSRRLFTEGGIGGHDFLRNLVHLPVYLQNSGLRKVQRAQLTALQYRRNINDTANAQDDCLLTHSASARRLSNASDIMSSQEKIRVPPPTTSANRGGSKKLRMSESIASSIGSNLHRLGNPQGAIDLSKIMLTDDYFSDVNPRSMRRLMNVIYITVRLLKAFQIDFSWYRLSSWINLTEQWPVRASLIVLQHDQSGDSLDDNVSLQSVYEKLRPRINCLKDAAPLLELDRDERKLDAFLQLHKNDLLVGDLRIFLPFTINLDPYLRKVLKEDQQAMEEEGLIIPTRSVVSTFRNPNMFVPNFSQYPNMYHHGAVNPNMHMFPSTLEHQRPELQHQRSITNGPAVDKESFEMTTFPVSDINTVSLIF